MTSIKSLFIYLFVCGLTYPIVLPAFAQEEQVEPVVLDPVVVSGGKEKVVSDTPQSVSVLNQNELDRKQPTTIGDALTDLPGVKAFGSDRVLGEAFNIRGFGQDNSGGEGRLILQVDGANKYYQQYRMGALFTDPELYKRVEVLRGPASSTLYGSGALAGVVTLETKDASDFLKDDDQFALRQKLEMTSNGYGGLSSTILASRPAENLEFLGAFIYRNNDDIKDGSGGQIRGSAFDAPSALVKSRYEFGNGNSQAVELSYQHWTTQEDEAEYEQTGTGGFGLVDREVTDKTVVLTYENAPLESDLIDFKARFSWSDTQVIQENANNTLPPPFDRSVLFDDSTYAYETYQLSFENTSILGSEDGLQTFLTTGVQGSWQTRTGEAERGFIPFQPGGRDTKVAAFAQAEMVFLNGLTLIPGLRVERAELNSDALNTNPNFNKTVTNTAVSPKLAALFEINKNWSLFGSVAYTERLPILDEIFDGASGNLELAAETGITYEIGTTYTTNDVFVDNDALVAKVTIFRNDTENLIERATQRDPFMNVAEARIDGVELEAAYNSERFFGNLALTVLRGDGREDSDDPMEEPLETIPADEVALTLGVRFPARNLELGLRSVIAARQDRLPENSNRDDTPGYGIHNLFATWRPDAGLLAGTEFRLGIENLFNDEYREHLSADPGRGRTLRLSMAQTF